MARPSTREEFTDYCLRRLGHPVIEINVDDDQVDDRIDDAIQLWHEHAGDGSTKIAIAVQVTSDMISQGYINLNTALPTFANRILSVNRVFPVNDSTSNVNFFDIKYQMRLNDMSDLMTGVGDLAYYEQMQQYLATIDLKLTGHPQIIFNRKAGLLYIQGDLKPQSGADIKEGDYIMIEMFISISEQLDIWNDMFLKEYATALIKKQWGENLSKFEGMQLPGGVSINANQILEDAKQEIETIRQRLYNEYDTPPDFFMG